QYIYRKYQRERAGMTATVITYRPRSAVRDVGKALGISADTIDALAKTVDRHAVDEDSTRAMLTERCREVGLQPESLLGQRLLGLVPQLLGFPRHLSQHTGGMVITNDVLCEVVPIENASMSDRTVVQWDKDDLDALGILKVDCLALGMLTAIHKAFDLLEQHNGKSLTLQNVPAEDPQVYDMICRADTIGVFQIESRAQMSMLPRLKPRTFYDLVIEVAIVRPGPIQGGMVHPYLQRRANQEKGEEKEKWNYPSKEIEDVLQRTLGVPIFQEQAMALAVVAAGFTPGEADQLRRAMGAWRRTGDMEQFRTKLVDGMREKGLPEGFAERVYKQICGFGEYGFPESHAASFARLAYISAWLKYYYPDVFCVSLMNSQPMGFYAPAQLLRDAQEHGVTVLPCDINHSAWDHTLASVPGEKSRAIRLGFRVVLSCSQPHATLIEETRKAGRFQSFSNFADRTKFPQAVLRRLANAGVFGSLGLDRREALWQAISYDGQALPLFDHLTEMDKAPPNLPALSRVEQVFADYATMTLSLQGHPLEFWRDYLETVNVKPAIELQDMENAVPISVAGIVLSYQRPGTASGVTFMTLEDETASANLVVFPEVWARFRRTALKAPLLIARGKLQRANEVIHVVVERLESIPNSIKPKTRRREFH
ncbi:MAG: error-prone DNA polymerase, partial [Pirellulales bacterium]|nr:error-prone DNA polymerase [Pirellulales bacterium]